MTQLFANAARSSLTSAVGSGATTLTVADGAAFPVADVGAAALDTGDWFKAVLDDGAGIEIVYVRTHSGNGTFSNVLRAQDGTTALAFGLGTVVGLRPTAGDAGRWEQAAALAARAALVDGGANADFSTSPRIDGKAMFTGLKGIAVVASLPGSPDPDILYFVEE